MIQFYEYGRPIEIAEALLTIVAAMVGFAILAALLWAVITILEEHRLL